MLAAPWHRSGVSFIARFSLYREAIGQIGPLPAHGLGHDPFWTGEHEERDAFQRPKDVILVQGGLAGQGLQDRFKDICDAPIH